MNEKTKAILKNPWVYILATFVWTWSIWGIGILLGFSFESASGLFIGLLGVTGPMITGIVFTYLTRDQAGRRDYWKRIIDFKRIPAKWYLAVILFHSMVNFTGEFIAISERADTITIALWYAVAIGITVIWGARTFTRKSRVQA